MKIVCSMTVVLIALGSAALVRAQDKKEDRDEQAKKLVNQFAKARWARDLDTLVKITDVPWFDNLSGKRRVIADRDLLKKELANQLPSEKRAGEVSFEAFEVISYARFLEKHKNGDKLLDQVLKKEDRLLNGRFVFSDFKDNAIRVNFMVGWRRGSRRWSASTCPEQPAGQRGTKPSEAISEVT